MTVQLDLTSDFVALVTLAEARDVLDPVNSPVVLGMGMLVALALTYLGINNLRLWSTGGGDDHNLTPERAFRRSFRGLIVATACFVATAAIAVLSMWALLADGF
jgi:hypothetical protein